MILRLLVTRYDVLDRRLLSIASIINYYKRFAKALARITGVLSLVGIE
jgi:hypothetical protein